MKTVSSARIFLAASFAAVALTTAGGPLAAQEAAVAGIWQTREGTPSGMTPEITSSDIQILYLTPDGHYRREIMVEGGDGVTGAAGKIIDTGDYRFTPPNVLQYRRRSWTVCTYAGCLPGQPIGPNAGTVPFQPMGQGQAVFLQLNWTRIR